MRKKHPMTPTPEKLDNLLRAFALQRLQKDSAPTAKPKAKRSKKREAGQPPHTPRLASSRFYSHI